MYRIFVKNTLYSTIIASALGFTTMPQAVACTSLSGKDANDKVYFGRTLELTTDLPYQIIYFPVGHAFSSDVGDGHPALEYTSKHAILSVAMPDVAPDGSQRPTLADFRVVKGQNDAGMTFSVLSYPSADGAQTQIEMTRAILSAMDLGTWTLGQFSTVEEVKSTLADQAVALAPLRALGGAKPPFHFVMHDRTGASIVIEFDQGKENIYDNPVGVMTNGPRFSWHLTNLANYTHLTTNVDRTSGRFGDFEVKQPDSGIATAGLPSSDTSVGRFVRAVYYSSFAEKVEDPDRAVQTLGHVMNNFDRPRNISVSDAGEGGALSKGLGLDAGQATEFTTWTRLGDLDRGLFFLRDYEALNYTMFDINRLSKIAERRIVPVASLHGMATDGTEALINPPASR